MENGRFWALSSKELREIMEKAEKLAKEEHPKQRRRRFDAEQTAIRMGIMQTAFVTDANALTESELIVGIVKQIKINLGTKKWSDYRAAYVPVFGQIEKETETSFKIAGDWVNKNKVFALVIGWTKKEGERC